MELTGLPPKPQAMPTSTLFTRLTPSLLRFPLQPPPSTAAFNLFAAAAASFSTTAQELPHAIAVPEPITPSPQKAKARTTTGKARGSKVISEALLKENWLSSLSCPFPMCSAIARSDWVIGVDPDTSGALALLKPDGSVEVFDSPHLMALVGKRVRKRLDAKSIVQLIQSFNAPTGTTAFIEQSIPYPQDGKQGWWSGGFGYGIWIGILVASGISVVPVPSLLWKNEFKLSGSRSSKDGCRELASTLFPSMSSMLKRKKDHGRAEALLIAAYGKGLRTPADSSCTIDNVVP